MQLLGLGLGLLPPFLNPLRACWFNRPRALEPPRHRRSLFTWCLMSIPMGCGRSCRYKCNLSTSCQYAPAVIVDDPQNVAQ
ncbi:hypothetical protein EV363DRAFT_1266131 [Boletus edulis]|nr:hypothetical protein EV363DRAFT_1266131 [Boletus edulis]